MTNLLKIFLLATTPLGELRLSIPMGILVYNIDPALVFFVSVIGNLIPAILLLLFLKKVSGFLSEKSFVFKRAFSWWENNAREKHIGKIQDYGAIGLALFIAVPLPLTGAWTGALLATIMNLPLKKSSLTVVAGVTGAGIIVTSAIMLGINIKIIFGWQTLVGVVAFAIIIFLFFKKKFHGK
ncbi:MAG: hypothetical protein A2528_03060 [Candidatus Staskawiczbacteria bacterium RIFOXYD2_FULL_37_9]|uniref:Ligand-binding protein SH3 n=1 Tax=Candidatus Staskawiczbacteria bacterium RIFOXYB1_FULL_37_44 TaxID=1802223 RepID=A0A1G2IYB7_9BACT|nr:MAG: hypothetical protein A2358_00030 [Candidatus Staskawiczbacteria bacterium RIFOXYB1_FULL_37_44]OGZ83731.1 MAG: hypothetical protein A2416_03975 [Candidatus Staskawiczbacteria bacterium RIFOXYC1_FULL_37_52]OGZ88131.1 MAG: hypothetical protein A2444_04330 [Candidatus Staskawiczbacteria bacterium RIFOXYC2_FULL_37_19]OGZ90257.1 MAG: hypothetical protein A2581_02510 [Candidatus Staskawiczbacteria bacterium RIFOXYD1_FULL_37_110]OGZ93036.1 MAG: hypothetical protein A2528_03060 [Candidatus Stask